VLLLIRRVGALVLVAAALFIWFGKAPHPSHGINPTGVAAAIEAQDNANNARTAGAPQQAVVNGWTSNDYLRLISKQLDTNRYGPVRDVRPAELLVLGVFGIALLAFTSPGPLLPMQTRSEPSGSWADSPWTAGAPDLEQSPGGTVEPTMPLPAHT
jgi:hypothetical protein